MTTVPTPPALLGLCPIHGKALAFLPVCRGIALSKNSQGSERLDWKALIEQKWQEFQGVAFSLDSQTTTDYSWETKVQSQVAHESQYSVSLNQVSQSH